MVAINTFVCRYSKTKIESKGEPHNMFTWIFKPQSPNSLNFCEFECSAYIQNCEPASSFVCADFSGCFSVLCLITYTGGSCIDRKSVV